MRMRAGDAVGYGVRGDRKSEWVGCRWLECVPRGTGDVDGEGNCSWCEQDEVEIGRRGMWDVTALPEVFHVKHFFKSWIFRLHTPFVLC